MTKDVTKIVVHQGQGLDFVDISSELWREYVYPGEVCLHIDEPIQLNVKRRDDGKDSHRIKDFCGCWWYVAPGWKAIRWACKPDEDIKF